VCVPPDDFLVGENSMWDRQRVAGAVIQCRELVADLTQKRGHPMKSISAVEAINRLNEPVTVEMRVKATKSCTCSSQFFLDSEENKRDPKNLGVIVTTDGATRFKDCKIDDPAVHFQGRTIRVHGTVVLKDDRPYIEVDDPAQIEIVA
jgi:hypothetical protein